MELRPGILQNGALRRGRLLFHRFVKADGLCLQIFLRNLLSGLLQLGYLFQRAGIGKLCQKILQGNFLFFLRLFLFLQLQGAHPAGIGADSGLQHLHQVIQISQLFLLRCFRFLANESGKISQLPGLLRFVTDKLGKVPQIIGIGLLRRSSLVRQGIPQILQ